MVLCNIDVVETSVCKLGILLDLPADHFYWIIESLKPFSHKSEFIIWCCVFVTGDVIGAEKKTSFGRVVGMTRISICATVTIGCRAL